MVQSSHSGYIDGVMVRVGTNADLSVDATSALDQYLRRLQRPVDGISGELISAQKIFQIEIVRTAVDGPLLSNRSVRRGGGRTNRKPCTRRLPAKKSVGGSRSLFPSLFSAVDFFSRSSSNIFELANDSDTTFRLATPAK